MKRTIASLTLTIVMAFSLVCSASAAFIPDDVTYRELNGQQQAVKIFTLLPSDDPAQLREQDFEHEGYLYSFSDMVKEEKTFSQQAQHTETVTVNTDSKDLAKVLEALQPSIEYEKDGYKGTLYLDHNSIKTEASGYATRNYSVTATKNYTGLDRNDTSYIDKTVVKDGRTLGMGGLGFTYVVGDIHGEFDRFDRLLCEVDYRHDDSLYILGDVVDRGPDGIRLLQKICDMDNTVLLAGNHEDMMIKTFAGIGGAFIRRQWFSNGGENTCRDFLRLPAGERDALLRWLQSLPDNLNVETGGQSWYLVHGSPGIDRDSRIWGRVAENADYSRLVGARTVVFGHTPVWYYNVLPSNGKYTVWKGNNNCICLDCGCGHLQIAERRLACLRLEDEALFYA